MKTNVYIDAFNLYYGALRGTPYRWLNLGKFCKQILPKNDINQIKYFTALVKPRPDDPQQPIRQQIYLRALKTLPQISIIFGHYLSHKVMLPLANSIGKKTQYVQVIKTEEKGSDVNLATHMLNDAYKNDYECAVIISNDSDLAEPIKIVKNELKKVVGILNPHKHPSRQLMAHASFYKKIRGGILKVSQFQETLEDKHGIIKKPSSW